MVARNRLISLIYRFLGFGACVASLVVNVQMTNDKGTLFLYFTILSGLAATICFGAMFIANLIDLIRHGPNGIPAGIYMPIAMSVDVYLTITAIVGNILFPFITSSGHLAWNMFLAHAIVPLLYILDWIIFEEKGTVVWWTSFYWLIFPILYAVFSFLRPFIWQDQKFGNGSSYPYPFLDPQASGGVGMVILNVVLLAIAFEATGLLFIFLNNLLAGKYRKRIKAE